MERVSVVLVLAVFGKSPPEEIVVHFVVHLATWLALAVLAAKALEWVLKELARSSVEIAESISSVILAIRKALSAIRNVGLTRPSRKSDDQHNA
jgi:hypothetical protein